MTTSIGALPFDLQERLFKASRDGPVGNILALVKEGADVVRFDADGRTALHHAAYVGNVQTARVILELGGDVHTPNAVGNTPLQYAAGYGHGAIVRVLVELGATYVNRARTE
jgi:hypothetical protein